jgi:outer membrane receptor protein involved in Fe transport
MRNVGTLLASVAAICILFASPTSAQTTGALAGKVVDATGGIMPGLTVVLSGPSMQGTQSVTTDPNGMFRFRNVPPGTGYTISVKATNFKETKLDNLQVFLGQEGTLKVVMTPASMTETIVVNAGSPLIDVTQTTIGMNITSAQFMALPGLRAFQQLTVLAPTVSLEMGQHDSRLGSSPTVGAASAPENNYIIDGLSATDPRYGTSGANVTMNFISEVQVMTGGYQAEYGRSTGGVFNVITKSGGNQFSGDVFTYLQNKSWSPENVAYRQNKELLTYANRDGNADFGGSLGGPIIKDKLWFFGAYDPSLRTTYLGGQLENGQPVPAGARDYTRNSGMYSGKITWTPKTGSTFVFTTFGDPTVRDGWLTNPNADESSALRTEKTGSYNFGGRYTSMLRPSWAFEISAGRHGQRSDLDPSTDIGRTVPRQVDETIGGYEHGGFQRSQRDTATRDAFVAKFTNIFGKHELRYGYDFERNNYNGDLAETWYRYFGTYIQERAYSVKGQGTTLNTALFVQDNWRLASNLQLNAGLRYETQRLNSANQVAIAGKSDAEACTVNGECRKVNGLTLQGHWAPRIGMVWDPLKNGRSKIYGSWGRYFEAMPLNINIRAINGESYVITKYTNPQPTTSENWYNPTGNPLSINGTWSVDRVTSLTVTTPLDENLKTQFQDEYVFGGEYQFGDYWTAGARYVHRQLSRIVEDIGTFTDPTDPIALTGYVIGNPGEGFFGAPFDKPVRNFDSVELTLQRRLHKNWQVYSSFVYAKAKGNHEGLYMSGYDQLDPNINALYDIPSFLPNSDGGMRASKPYQFKVHGSYLFNWGLTVSEGFVLSAGVPISAQGPEIVNGYGDGVIFLLPRGSEGRTDMFWNFDLHLDYRLPFLNKNNPRQISLVLDVLNLFNRHGVMEVDQDYIWEGMDGIEAWEVPSNLDAYGNPKYNPSLANSTFYKTPILWQPPRIVQFGVRFIF